MKAKDIGAREHAKDQEKQQGGRSHLAADFCYNDARESQY
jgi:hypothetical protein